MNSGFWVRLRGLTRKLSVLTWNLSALLLILVSGLIGAAVSPLPVQARTVPLRQVEAVGSGAGFTLLTAADCGSGKRWLPESFLRRPAFHLSGPKPGGGYPLPVTDPAALKGWALFAAAALLMLIFSVEN
jgi:hypothetical protein